MEKSVRCSVFIPRGVGLCLPLLRLLARHPLGCNLHRAGGSTMLKRGVFKFLEWLFEGETLTPAVCVFLYTVIWFLPVWVPHMESNSDIADWIFLGWFPTVGWAVAINLLSLYQVLCCHVLPCIRWTRIVTSVLVSAFVIYTAIAPAYAMWVRTGMFPEAMAGSVVVVLACILLVARNLQKEGEYGKRAA